MWDAVHCVSTLQESSCVNPWHQGLYEDMPPLLNPSMDLTDLCIQPPAKEPRLETVLAQENLQQMAQCFVDSMRQNCDGEISEELCAGVEAFSRSQMVGLACSIFCFLSKGSTFSSLCAVLLTISRLARSEKLWSVETRTQSVSCCAPRSTTNLRIRKLSFWL